MKSKLMTAAAGAAALFMISPTFAQSTADVRITSILRVQDGCAINGGVNNAVLDFGTIVNAAARTDDVRASTQTGGGPIIVSCNVSSTTATFQINAGFNDAGGVHRLRNVLGIGGAPGEFLEYRLFSDLALTSEYLISTPLPVNGGVITSGVPFEIIVYGRILNAQAVQAVAGFYQDITTGVLTF